MRIAQSFLLFEPLIIAVIVCAYWYPDSARTLTLLLVIPVLVARWVTYRRLFTFLPIIGLMIAFIAVGVLSQFIAPYHWLAAPITIPGLGWSTAPIGSGWVLLGSLVMGLALVIYFVEHARTRGSIDSILLASACLGLLIAVAPLAATQWNEKSALLDFMTGLLPRVSNFPGAVDGFNANEIGGVLAWLTPLMAGLALYRRPLRLVAALAFWLLLLALFLGQSRLAIVGVVVGLAGVIGLLIPAGRPRTLALVGLALFIALEVALAGNLFVPQRVQPLAVRDNWSTTGRLDIWHSALSIIRDYPLTGVGVNQFAAGQVRQRYPAPGYGTKFLPHAHNEFLQVGTDLGIPGMLLFGAWYAAIGVMLVQTWRRGDRSARVVVVASGAGLVAHGAFFGMADAIALWERFAFVFWWLMGLAAAQYTLTRYHGAVRKAPAADAVEPAKPPSRPATS